MPALSTLAALDPAREALVVVPADGGGPRRRYTYGELAALANRTAHALRARGLRRGDALAVVLGNGAGVFAVYWACMVLGVDHVPVNPRLERDELAYLFADSGARGVVAGAAARGDVAGAARAAEVGFVVDEDELMADAAGRPDTLPEDPWEGGLLFYSSGTTGQPKGVVRDFPSVRPGDPLTLGSDLARVFGFRAEDRYLSPGPLYHSAPLTWSTAHQRVGAAAVVMERFDAGRALRLLDEERITTSQWVPTMFSRLLALDPDERATVHPRHRLAAHAAAPCPVPLKRAMLEWWGPIIVEYYSGSEGGRTMISAEEWLTHPGSVGRHWKGGTIHILDEAGEAVAPGTDGLVFFDAPAVGRFHYINRPEATAEAYRGDRFTLGEVGHLDADGYLYLTGRATDLVISGGVNLYPAETEDALRAHPAVTDVACFGAPDDDLGEILVAAVVTGEPVSGDQLIDWLRGRLAVHKLPRQVLFVDELPRSEAGKVLRRELATQYSSSSQNG